LRRYHNPHAQKVNANAGKDSHPPMNSRPNKPENRFVKDAVVLPSGRIRIFPDFSQNRGIYIDKALDKTHTTFYLHLRGIRSL
jgi:hypothetical protein